MELIPVWTVTLEKHVFDAKLHHFAEQIVQVGEQVLRIVHGLENLVHVFAALLLRVAIFQLVEKELSRQPAHDGRQDVVHALLVLVVCVLAGPNVEHLLQLVLDFEVAEEAELLRRPTNVLLNHLLDFVVTHDGLLDRQLVPRLQRVGFHLHQGVHHLRLRLVVLLVELILVVVLLLLLATVLLAHSEVLAVQVVK